MIDDKNDMTDDSLAISFQVKTSSSRKFVYYTMN